MPRQLAGLLCVLLGLARAPALPCPLRATDPETPAASAAHPHDHAPPATRKPQLNVHRHPADPRHTAAS
ncbi:hypothetical protein ACLI38_02775, partial [Pseudomonas aeruginosa]